MDIITFMDRLKQDLEKVLSDVTMNDPDGERCHGVHVYRNFLPKISEDDEDVTKYFPYVIICPIEAETMDDFDTWVVTTELHLGVYNADERNNGADHVMVMIQRIIDRYSQEAMLRPAFRCEPAMSWALQDEDTYPFYFGYVVLKFRLPKIGRSEPIYG